MNNRSIYAEILATYREISDALTLYNLLFWDQQTSLPAKASKDRGILLENVASKIHEMEVCQKLSSRLDQLIDMQSGELRSPKEWSHVEARNLALWREDFLAFRKIPLHLNQKLAASREKGLAAWKKARQGGSPEDYLLFLEESVALNREKAECLGYQNHPYEALLSSISPTFRSLAPATKKADLDLYFAAIKQEILPLAKQFSKNPSWQKVSHHYTESEQSALRAALRSFMHLPEDEVTISTSPHPFCLQLGPHDQRFTLNFSSSHPIEHPILAFLHEGGHAMYSMQLPKEHYGTPAGGPLSMVMHESQARLWETAVGLSRPFSEWLFPQLKAIFHSPLPFNHAEQLYAYLNRVSPCHLRLSSNELFYNLHICLRYEAEVSLLEGSLSVQDLRAFWDSKSQEYLLTTPPSDQEGYLQDIHWSFGMFGYFPTYTLGNMTMAQLWEAFQTQHPNWGSEFAKGETAILRSWLQDNLHQHGRIYTLDELLQRVTGHGLSVAPLINYLKDKFK